MLLGLRRLPPPLGDDPRIDIGAAIIDPQPQRAPVPQIADLDDARQRQGLMRRRQLVQIEDLAIRGRLPIERFAIPRGEAGLVVAVIDLRVVPLAIDLIRGADLVRRLTAMVPAALLFAELRT